jgi:hypothetical protein
MFRVESAFEDKADISAGSTATVQGNKIELQRSTDKRD